MPDRKPKREVQTGERAPRHCSTCGREMEWRKAWAKNWDEVKFCSDGCRKHRPAAQDEALEATILELLGGRGAGKTICPSEAARAVAGAADGRDDRATWEPLMGPARAAARRLVAAGKIVITQGGQVVDGSTARGAIRLRLR